MNMQNLVDQTCRFTGHRQLSEEIVIDLQRSLEKEIVQIHSPADQAGLSAGSPGDHCSIPGASKKLDKEGTGTVRFDLAESRPSRMLIGTV